jgi:hypothetical protein
MTSRNKNVRQACYRALTELAGEIGGKLITYLELIVQKFSVALDFERHEDASPLYDAIGAVADDVQRALAKPYYAEVFLPKLVARWSKLAEDDKNINVLTDVRVFFL